MSSQGASLQNYNLELVKMFESIKESRDEINAQIENQERQKEEIERQMRMLADTLQELNGSLQKNYEVRKEFDRTIGETQNAYDKIVESSQTLLHVLKKEGQSLTKKKAATFGQPLGASSTQKWDKR